MNKCGGCVHTRYCMENDGIFELSSLRISFNCSTKLINLWDSKKHNIISEHSSWEDVINDVYEMSTELEDIPKILAFKNRYNLVK